MPPRPQTALLIGNSDGVGLATTQQLLADGWRVAGISRSASPVQSQNYHHTVADIRSADYRDALQSSFDRLGEVDVCIYCAGIGDPLSLDDLENEVATFEVNLLGAVIAVETVMSRMVSRGSGHFIGLSSQADVLVNRDAPSYSASKAGLSMYLESLGLAAAPRGVHVTNVRFGFVDTKMAKSEVRPFMLSPERAAAHILRCIGRRPRRYTTPKRMAVLMWFLAWGSRLRRWFS